MNESSLDVVISTYTCPTRAVVSAKRDEWLRKISYVQWERKKGEIGCARNIIPLTENSTHDISEKGGAF